MRVIDGDQQRPAGREVDGQPVQAVQHGERRVDRRRRRRLARAAAAAPRRRARPAAPRARSPPAPARRRSNSWRTTPNANPPRAPTRGRAGPRGRSSCRAPARRLDQRRLADARPTLDHEHRAAALQQPQPPPARVHARAGCPRDDSRSAATGPKAGGANRRRSSGVRAQEGELRVSAVGGVAGGDDPAGGVEREILAELAPAVEVGRDDPVAVEAGVQGAVRVVADERHVEDRGAAGAADEDDPAVGVDEQVLREVVAAAEVGLDRAVVAEGGVEAAGGGVAGQQEVPVDVRAERVPRDRDVAVGGERDGGACAITEYCAPSALENTLRTRGYAAGSTSTARGAGG